MATDGEDREQRLAEAERELADARAQPDGGERLARALIRRALALRAVDRGDEALADLAEVVDRFPAGEDLRLRELLTWALFLRMRWSTRDDGERLQAAREIFALCRDQPSGPLERRAALALGAQADAQRALGNLREAIATRRWLLSEYGDVRPRTRPELVYDQWFGLARDLYFDDQLAESLQTCEELIDALDGAEVSAPQTRVADALQWQIYPWWKLGDPARSLAVYGDLQRRFAGASEPAARRVAATAVANMVQRRQYERDLPGALALAETLRARFIGEGDTTNRARIGIELERVADSFAASFQSRPVGYAVSVVTPVRARRRAAALLRRPRMRGVAMALTQLDCADQLAELLRACFAGDSSTVGRSIYGRTVLLGGLIAGRRGHLLACARACEAFYSLPPAVISAVLTTAETIGEDRYRMTDWMAALLATTVPPDPEHEAATRAAIQRLLSSRSTVPVNRRYVAFQLRSLERSAR